MSRELPQSQYARLATILSVVSDDYALALINNASVGFKSGNATIRQLHLSPRRYYRKLKELIDAGLIIQVGEDYKLTPLGHFLHRLLIVDFSGYLANEKPLITESGERLDFIVINDLKSLTDFLVKTIDNCKSEVLLATRYMDLAVVQSLVYALERKVKIRTVTSSKINIAGFLKLIGDSLLNFQLSMVKFSMGKDNYRAGYVPLSLIIIDGEISVFEIPNKQLQLAFISKDKAVSKVLTELFWELWHESNKLPLSI